MRRERRSAPYLADRVVVRAGTPGHAVADHAIDAPRPRARHDAAVAAIVADIRHHLGAVS